MKRLFAVVVLSLVALLMVQPVAAQSTLSVRGENDVPGPVNIEVFTANSPGGALVSQGTLSFAANDNSCSDLSMSIPSDTRKIRFVFLNDFFNGTGFEQPADINDRNAFIDFFTVNGVRFEGEAPSATSQALLTPSCGNPAIAFGVTGSFAEYILPGPVITSSIPTLSQWGIIVLVAFVGLLSFFALKRARA